MACILDMMLEEASIPLVRVLRIVDETAIGGVVLYHPQVGEVFYDIAVGIDAPLLVGTANPVDAQTGSDVGSIVKGLRHILQAAPYQDVQRTVVLTASLLHNPLRTLRRLAPATGGCLTHTALLHQRAQLLGRHQPLDMLAQPGQILFIDVYHAQNLTLVPIAKGG